MVAGWFYIRDVSRTFDVSGGNSNATDIIGLRRDLAGQTVRIFHGRGAANSKYSLVQDRTGMWEIPLVEVLLDGSGNYSSHTDVRKFLRSPGASRILLYESVNGGMLTNLTIPPAFSELRVEFNYSGIDTTVKLQFNNDTSLNYTDSSGTARDSVLFSDNPSGFVHLEYRIMVPVEAVSGDHPLCEWQAYSGNISSNYNSERYSYNASGGNNTITRLDLSLGGNALTTGRTIRVWGIR
jgi:hypothetical protein